MCNHGNRVYVQAKCSDMCFLSEHDKDDNIVFESDGYVPEGYGIGDGDYIEFAFCKECKCMI